ncbi:hypothetical protein PBAL39_21160 [Pedobacter sp. BAL39]|uniref:molybdopterin-dependent oxidoreductase n=1 Tax=Pedobacter sp. BAL39 TaxID=391596 RepID=UPI0001559982|nr:molybdopterin-dependent oxidoreductase [Pedobacter sp. BAL39]EDM38623.1 hypothetical protein PBAL39_21160 [Pedobacter sp. BAL39]
MKKLLLLALIWCVQMGSPSALLHAQTGNEPLVKISGEVGAALSLGIKDLKAFKQIEVRRKDRDGKDHLYSGVSLSLLLSNSGVTLGKDLRGENLTKFMLAEASDGYQVIFALAELDPEFTDRQVILAHQVDGQPLPAADGPFRIIVEGEKKPARCIKQVTSLRIEFAK